MSPEKQRIALAEYCGVQVIYWRAKTKSHDGYETYSVHNTKQEAEDCHFNELGIESFVHLGLTPDYLNNLNAINEAKKKLSLRDFHYYEVYLMQIIKRDSDPSKLWSLSVHCASAAQECEAFLRAIGKWEGPDMF